MFEYLGGYNVVLVTGPQRSGTTITARMIAADTGLAYVDEQAFIADCVAMWRDVVKTAQRSVIQCPGMARFMHEVGSHDDVAVVFMHRDPLEIIASQQRISWSHEAHELSRYPDDWQMATIAATKGSYWCSHQRRLCAHPFDIDYDSITAHPLYVAPGERALFQPRQWRV